jgi:hypothetical protein
MPTPEGSKLQRNAEMDKRLGSHPEATSGPRLWRCRQMEIASLGEAFQFAKHVKAQGGRVGVVRCVGRGAEIASGAGCLLLLPGLEKCQRVMTSAWTGLETMWKNRGLMSKDIRMLFLSPLTSIHVKKRGPNFLTSHRNLYEKVTGSGKLIRNVEHGIREENRKKFFCGKYS